ncbi:DMT family transporter [Desulfobulbus alkaliphilus]|nr:DMT family transporter [Desulfobulbus alkaliphilus]
MSPVILMFTGAFIISFSGVWVQLAQVSPTASAFYRVFFGFLFLLAICLCKGDPWHLSVRHLAWAILCGFFFALDLFCWHASILYIGPGLATILGNFQVFCLAIIGILFLGERPRITFLPALPLAGCGLFLVVGTDWQALPPTYRLGLVLGLMTAISYSGFLLILRKLQGAASSSSFFFNLMLVSGATAFFLGGYMVMAGESFTIPDTTSLAALLGLGLLSQTIGWSLIANAMPKIPASLVGFLLLLQPALTFVWDVLFFSRPTSLINWLGVLVLLGALYLAMLGSGQPAPASTPRHDNHHLDESGETPP